VSLYNIASSIVDTLYKRNSPVRLRWSIPIYLRLLASKLLRRCLKWSQLMLNHTANIGAWPEWTEIYFGTNATQSQVRTRRLSSTNY
jgi:hypothetical protein